MFIGSLPNAAPKYKKFVIINFLDLNKSNSQEEELSDKNREIDTPGVANVITEDPN